MTELKARPYDAYVLSQVAIFRTSGSRIAVDFELSDVLPSTPGQIFLVSQGRWVLAAVAKADVRKVYASRSPRELLGEIRQGLISAGFRVVKRNGVAMLHACPDARPHWRLSAPERSADECRGFEAVAKPRSPTARTDFIASLSFGWGSG